MAKKIIHNPEAHQLLFAGVETLAEAVLVTMGAKGQNVMIEAPYVGYPQVTKDGVTVAKAIDVSDPVQNQAVSLMKHVALMTNQKVGDGSTTSIALAYKMIGDGIEILRNSETPINTSQLSHGMQVACNEIIRELDLMVIPVDSPDKIKNIATISSNNDIIIGELVAQAFDKVGQYGAVRINSSTNGKNYLEVSTGMRLDGGVISPLFLPPNAPSITLENPYVAVTDLNITDINPFIADIADDLRGNKTPVVIICNDINTDILQRIIILNKRDNIPLYIVKAPLFGKDRTTQLEDLATLLGTTVLSGELGMTAQSFKRALYGGCGSVTLEDGYMTFFDGDGKEDKILSIVKDIDSALELTTSADDKEFLIERRAKLANGVANIYLDARSEVEFEEMKYRLEDSINATRVAIQGGMVPGGGVALKDSAIAIWADTFVSGGDKLSESGALGWQIVMSALEFPMRRIIQNSGADFDSYDSEILLPKRGVNALTNKLCNVEDEGIVDPYMVTKTALESAVKVASTILTTTCVIVEDSIHHDKEQ